MLFKFDHLIHPCPLGGVGGGYCCFVESTTEMRCLKLLVVLMTPLKILYWALPGAGSCAEHISGMIPYGSQESPRYSSCPHAHMGKLRHRKQIM